TPWISWILSPRADFPPGGAETQILMLAKALARRGLRVAIIVFGDESDLPAEVDGVTIIARPAYVMSRRLVGKIIEAFQIWRSLSQAPSDVVVNRGAGATLGLVTL